MLSIQTEFLRREKLASYHVHTPDPLLNQPLVGQRILLEWTIPDCYFAYEDLHIELTIRFGNRTEEIKYLKALDKSGMYIYLLRDKEFQDRKGIQTYKAELIGGGCILSEWRHQLWTEMILIGHDENEDDEDEDEDEDEEDKKDKEKIEDNDEDKNKDDEVKDKEDKEEE